MPGLAQLRDGGPDALRADLAAGLSLTAVLLPASVAYAVASGLPAAQGLYAALAALLAYAVFGPSRVLVLGPDSSLVALTLVVLLPLSAGDPARATALAAALALVAGLICVAAGWLQLGFVTDLLSKPIRLGYMNGIALTVLVSQLPALFGFRVQGDGLGEMALAFVRAVGEGRTNTAALALGIGTLVAIVLLRRWPRFPGLLLAVALATLVCAGLDLGGRAGVPVLGPVPQGLPALAWPALQRADLVPLLLNGLAIALVAVADTSVLSRALAGRRGERVDTSQEMVGLGAANVAAAVLQGMPVSASASRSSVASAAGARTQRTGLVAAVLLVAVLLLSPAGLSHLPNAALAAVVIVSAASLVEVGELRRIHRMERWEFWLSIGCLLGVVFLGALAGIALAVAAALIEFIWAAWRPHSAVLGRVDGLRGYHDVERHPEAHREPGLLLFRWDAPLFFANAEVFRDRVQEAMAAAPAPVRWVVVGAEPMTRVDVTGAEVLDELDHQLAAAGVTLALAEVKGPVKDTLRRYGLFRQLGDERFFRTLDDAVERWHQLRPELPAHGTAPGAGIIEPRSPARP